LIGEKNYYHCCHYYHSLLINPPLQKLFFEEWNGKWGVRGGEEKRDKNPFFDKEFSAGVRVKNSEGWGFCSVFLSLGIHKRTRPVNVSGLPGSQTEITTCL
jgi:hypothetical protein